MPSTPRFRKRVFHNTLGAPVAALVLVIFCALPATAVPEKPQDNAALQALSDKYAADVREVLAWLHTQPPVAPGDDTRKHMLLKLDPPLLVYEAGYLPIVGEFFRARMQAFLRDFENTRVDSGVVIWKLYNHTEVIKTPEATLVTDLIQGWGEIFWDDAGMDRLIAGVDALLISHQHGDHIDIRVLRKFKAAGKPVYAPEIPSDWRDDPDADYITLVRDESFEINGVKIYAFPAFQKTTINNVYLIQTPGGVRVMHLGDDNESLRMGQEWFRRFGAKGLDIDILIPNCWCPNLALLLEYVKPQLMISSHEHEVGHPVHGRREYGELYKVLPTVNVPFVVPAWGEKVVWPGRG